MKRRVIVTAVGLALMLGLTGCGSSAPKSADSSTGSSADVKELQKQLEELKAALPDAKIDVKIN